MGRVEPVQRIPAEVRKPVLLQPIDLLPRVAFRLRFPGLSVDPLGEVLGRGDNPRQGAIRQRGDATGRLDAGSGFVGQLVHDCQQPLLRGEVVDEDGVRRRPVRAAPRAESERGIGGGFRCAVNSLRTPLWRWSGNRWWAPGPG